MYTRLCKVGEPCIDYEDLQYVPDEYITPEVCIAAVKHNAKNIQHVPKHIRTSEMCIEAIKQDPRAIIYYISDTTKEMWIEAVSRLGELLENTPSKYKSKELCEVAVKNDPLALKWVDIHQTQEMCDSAVSRDSQAIVYAKDKFKTQAMCDNLELVDGIGKYIPSEFMTPELKKKLDDYYERNNYATIGPIKVFTEYCIQTSPCKYYIIKEDGASSIISEPKLHDLLEKHGVLDEWKKL